MNSNRACWRLYGDVVVNDAIDVACGGSGVAAYVVHDYVAATEVYVTSEKICMKNYGRSVLLKCISTVHLDCILKLVVDKQKPVEKCIV